jgi:RimJ/RimL family protein N-acetyltransferase
MNLTTSRLLIHGLTTEHSEFILELLNTKEWKQFIGERNINTKIDAEHYIHKINGNPNVNYWSVHLKEDNTPIGIITFIQRDYLLTPDIGFAFLPQFVKKGYAFEATSAVLEVLIQSKKWNEILAITNTFNQNSIKLLERLSFQLISSFEKDGEELLKYKIELGK